mgnify:CR=1 FL=1
MCVRELARSRRARLSTHLRYAGAFATTATALSACSLLFDPSGITGGVDDGRDSSGPARDSGYLDTEGSVPSFDAADENPIVDAALRSADAPEAVDGPPGPPESSVPEAGDGSAADSLAETGSPGGADSSDSSDSSDASDASDDGPTCTGTLSNVGTGDFDVSFAVTTTQGGLVALVNQRQHCGPAVFWDVRLDNGSLRTEVDDVTTYAMITTVGAVVNDGQRHRVLVQRRSGALDVYIDGVLSANGGSGQNLTALPPASVGVDVCDGNDGTVALVGSIDALCIENP